MNKKEIETAQILLANPRWRLNNLYQIVDKQGNKARFKMNWAQEELFNGMHYCNLILKARQLGISTFICLLFLDRCLFNSNISAGIIAHTIEDAQQLFRRVKFAYDNLPEELKTLRQSNTDTAQMIQFSNGSSLRVGMSLRSSTFQYLHISEFGKICAKFPDKAREIVTGSLNTLAAGQYCFIESTAEGREGYFYEMCKEAQSAQSSGKKLTQLDFRFFFFPWYQSTEYRLDNSATQIPVDLVEYFKDLAENNKIVLHPSQMCWYAKKYATQYEDMKREYPSTPEEAFRAATDGLYYGKYLAKARNEKRMGRVTYGETVPTFAALDLGFNDSTAIWWYQIVGQEIHVIDYYEMSGEPLTHYIKILKDKPYIMQKYFVPHDANNTEYGSGLTRIQIARNHGITLTPVPKLSIQEGIDAVRNILGKCWFDEQKCEKGLRSLENYRKEWNERHGCWSDKPVHDFSSDGADAFRYLAVSLRMANTKQQSSEEAERQRQAKASRAAFDKFLAPACAPNRLGFY